MQETIASGANALLPAAAPDELAALIARQRHRRDTQPWTPEAYGDGRAASRVVDAVGGLLD
jgi:hypothetical protein